MRLSPWSLLPFGGILLTIAIFPLVNEHLWWKYYSVASVVWGLPVAVWVCFVKPIWLFHTAVEYFGFIALLGSLFVIAGGIHIKGRMPGTPRVNTLLLAAGCVLANFIGTTGASMVLVRPLLRANAGRTQRTHQVVFLIFLVSNIGGCLTPLGDPPLFLGLLKGVPFFWTLRLAPEWLVACGLLLGVFYVVDTWYYRRETDMFPVRPERIVIEGKQNFLFLGGVLFAVLLYSMLPRGLGLWREVIQMAVMVLMTVLSWRLTPRIVHTENEFTWHPIQEVAILFAGIFACMIPALQILYARGGELGVTQPWQFFWASGALSSFLDNAPTYLSFLSLGMAVSHDAAQVLHLHNGPIGVSILKAISLGAVFMGANTYIGNGPNFMVKSLATHLGVRMPSFFGYMAWSMAILMPVFVLITLLFFR